MFSALEFFFGRPYTPQEGTEMSTRQAGIELNPRMGVRQKGIPHIELDGVDDRYR